MALKSTIIVCLVTTLFAISLADEEVGTVVEPLRALVVFPVPGRSHSIVGHSIVDILLQDGFEVTFVTPYPREKPAPGLTYVNVSSVISQVSGGEKLNMAQLAVNPRPPHAALRIGPMFNARALRDPAMQALLTDTSQHFDLVVTEWFYSNLLAPLATIYKAPLVWYSAADVSWQTLDLIHEPSCPAYTVEQQARHMPKRPFSFRERTYNLGMQLYLGAWKYYIETFVEPSLIEDVYSAAMKARGSPGLCSDAAKTAARSAALLLLNVHPPLGQLPPLPHNAHYIGGHHVDLPPKPLPEHLQQLLDEAEHGVIFFSMGSNLKSTDFPENMKQELVQLFGQLKQTVLWKFEEQLDNLPSNVYILDWAPQTSILNHPNVKLFITHGGLLSQIEATQFGVPLIGIPLFGDQFVNVDLSVHRGCSLRADFTPDLPKQIKKAIDRIMSDEKFSSCAARSALEFSARPSNPRSQTALLLRAVAQDHLPARASPRTPALARLPAELALLPFTLLLIFLLLRPLIPSHSHTHIHHKRE